MAISGLNAPAGPARESIELGQLGVLALSVLNKDRDESEEDTKAAPVSPLDVRCTSGASVVLPRLNRKAGVGVVRVPVEPGIEQGSMPSREHLKCIWAVC
jgi:hypothetical protein